MALATPTYGPRLPRAQGYKGVQNPQQQLPLGGAPVNGVTPPNPIGGGRPPAPPSLIGPPSQISGAPRPDPGLIGPPGQVGGVRPPSLGGGPSLISPPVMPDGQIQPPQVPPPQTITEGGGRGGTVTPAPAPGQGPPTSLVDGWTWVNGQWVPPLPKGEVSPAPAPGPTPSPVPSPSPVQDPSLGGGPAPTTGPPRPGTVTLPPNPFGTPGLPPSPFGMSSIDAGGRGLPTPGVPPATTNGLPPPPALLSGDSTGGSNQNGQNQGGNGQNSDNNQTQGTPGAGGSLVPGWTLINGQWVPPGGGGGDAGGPPQLINSFKAPPINLPDQSGPQNQLLALLQQMMASGGSLNDSWMANARSAQQADAATMGRQLNTQTQQQAAQRGTSASGSTGAAQRQNQQALVNSLLGGFRDLNVQRATQNWQDQMGAAGATESALGGQFQRSAAGQQMLQDQYFGEQDLGLRQRQLAIQKALGDAGINVDMSRLSEMGREFDLGHQLNWANFINNMVMGRSQLGLGYAGLNFNNQQGVLNWLAGLGGAK